MSKQEPEIQETPPPTPPQLPPLPLPPTAIGNREMESDNGNPYLYPRTEPSYYKDDKSDNQWRSLLVPMVVVVHVVVFVIQMYVNNCRPDHRYFNSPGGYKGRKCMAEFLGRMSFLPIKENPLLGPSSLALVKMGAVERYRVVYSREVWRVASSIWLHAGLIHLLINMMSVVFIGTHLEKQFGFVKVGIIYVLSGMSGSLLSCFFLHGNVSAGASAPLFGLLGAMLAELITNCHIYSNKTPVVFTLLLFGAMNAVISILPRVGNFGNIGGFLTGFLLGFVLLLRPQYGWVDRKYRTVIAHFKAKYKASQYVLWLVSLVGLVLGFTACLVLLFAVKLNGNKHCSWCYYLICVPSSRWHCQS